MGKMTVEDIEMHIDENIEKWLFVGHIAERHFNVKEEELQARLGKYSEEGKLITYASSFLDMSDGDDIVEGLTADLKSCAGDILDWLRNGKNGIVPIRFSSFPKGVSGITCSVSHEGARVSHGYLAVLCKTEQYPFYLLNAYPII